ncbi:GNAT family N-acetyltransferase [Aeoliella mucimassa]|uniref:BioF2-like acetyltransferase domain-containing protein n=1 Tax=Aeoliella mucimassa TaxID=2527972 RepID=A0A518AWE6_9BACT|nr:GNAT family N-acetyltransferase [Aeoliella mucimassa]QDU59057.1 hypothetical protein Pan181_52980 [Aeoliella mucimassa]
MAEVFEINDIDTLQAYRADWDRLFAETPDAHFFQTLDWLTLYWQHFGRDQQLRVLIVTVDQQVIGIVPLCVRTQWHKLGPIRTLGYPLEGWGNSFGPLAAHPALTMALAMNHLATTPRNWDRLQLDWVDDSPAHLAATDRCLKLAGLPAQAETHQSRAIIEFPDGWQTYLASRSTKTRQELRRLARRADNQPNVEYVRYRPESVANHGGDPRWDLYDQCEQVSRQSWQCGSTNGNTLCHARYREFYRAAHAAAARLGMLDLNLLLVDNQPVAFNYNYHCDGRIIGLRMGYDAAQSLNGAGLTLLALSLRDSCHRGDQSLDMGFGNQDFKQRLQTSEQPSYCLTHTPRYALRCQALRIGHWLRNRRSLERSELAKQMSGAK